MNNIIVTTRQQGFDHLPHLSDCLLLTRLLTVLYWLSLCPALKIYLQGPFIDCPTIRRVTVHVIIRLWDTFQRGHRRPVIVGE